MRSYFFQPATEEIRPPSRQRAEPLRRAGRSVVMARAVAGLMAGNGILNLISLMGGPVPTEQPEWLRVLFPIDFPGSPRSVTLLCGFALVLAAIHLWSLRRRAWQLSLVLSAASIAVNVKNSWQPEDVLFGAVTAALLWSSGKNFPRASSTLPLASAIRRVAGAYLVAGMYGAAGFWLLEPAEFNRNFHWVEAILCTVRRMFFLGDSALLPITAYGAWFLDSLFWISLAAFLYSGFVLIRPVAYRFTVNWGELDLAERIAMVHGRTAQDYFKHWPDKTYFFSSSRQSFLGYRVVNHYALALGDPVGPAEDAKATIAEFVAFCQERGWRMGFHQAGTEFLEAYESLGFRRMKVGEDAIVDLSRFSLTGSAMKEFRNTVTRLERLGYRVERVDSPLSEPLFEELKRISDSWLQIPGHREREFTLGRFERWYVQSTPIYVAFDANNQAVAFLNLVPSYDPALATVDLMRRGRETVNGLMDYLFAKVFLDLKERGVQRFSLGMAPLSDQNGTGTMSQDERLVHWIMNRMPFLFRSDSLRRFKAKYAHEWTPRYAIYQGRTDLARLAFALRRVSERRSDAKWTAVLGGAA